MIERFYCVGPEGSQMLPDPIGGYVRWGDYDALAAAARRVTCYNFTNTRPDLTEAVADLRKELEGTT